MTHNIKSKINRCKIAFSTNAFINYPLDTALDKISRCGYCAVEILADVPHGFELIKNPRSAGKIISVLNSSGLKISNINANTAIGLLNLPAGSSGFEPSLSNPDESVRKKRIRFTADVIDLALDLGADTISITTGTKSDTLIKKEQMDFFYASLDEILKIAEKKKIYVGIEPEPGLLIGSTDEAATAVQKYNSPYFGINWDAGHAESNSENLSFAIDKFGRYFFNLHIEDIKNKVHYHLIPGEGDINFKSLFYNLSCLKYDKYITVELYTYKDNPEYAAKKALDYLLGLEF